MADQRRFPFPTQNPADLDLPAEMLSAVFIGEPRPPVRRYVRVVLAYDPKDEEQFMAALDEFIEADDEQAEAALRLLGLEVTPENLEKIRALGPIGWNGVQGAHVSAPYKYREDALHGEWKAQ